MRYKSYKDFIDNNQINEWKIDNNTKILHYKIDQIFKEIDKTGKKLKPTFDKVSDGLFDTKLGGIIAMGIRIYNPELPQDILDKFDPELNDDMLEDHFFCVPITNNDNDCFDFIVYYSDDFYEKDSEIKETILGVLKNIKDLNKLNYEIFTGIAWSQDHPASYVYENDLDKLWDILTKIDDDIYGCDSSSTQFDDGYGGYFSAVKPTDSNIQKIKRILKSAWVDLDD